MRIGKEVILRMLFFLVVGIVLAAVFSEIAFRLQGNTTSREPKTVKLVIPDGTSAKLVQGQSNIPAGQVFMIGDTLLVVNEDSSTQTLGPLVIPPGSSASMKLDQVGNLSYTCSFTASKFYGIQVQQGITMGMRVQAALLAGVPMGMLLGVYSLVLKPPKSKAKASTM